MVVRAPVGATTTRRTGHVPCRDCMASEKFERCTRDMGSTELDLISGKASNSAAELADKLLRFSSVGEVVLEVVVVVVVESVEGAGLGTTEEERDAGEEA
jgi:hypothetical protein